MALATYMRRGVNLGSGHEKSAAGEFMNMERLLLLALALWLNSLSAFAAGQYFEVTYPGSKNTNELVYDVAYRMWIPDGVKTEESDKLVTSNFVEAHITVGIEALKLIRRHGKSVKHLRFDE